MKNLIRSAIGAVSIGLCLTPTTALADFASHPIDSSDRTLDRWNLSDADWLVLTGPELRRKAGLPENIAAVIREAKGGDAKAAALLSGAYATGVGVQKNPQEGLRWAKVAADAGLPFGLFVYGQYFRNGIGVTADYRQAAQLYAIAYQKGVRATAVEYATLPAFSETKDILPIYTDQIDMLEQARDDQAPLAAEFLEIFALQEEFGKIIDGMPMWKTSRGLLSGHVDFALPLNACTTVIRTTGGTRFTLLWNLGYKGRNPQSTSFVLEGRIMAGSSSSQSINGPHDGTWELGVFLKETNTSFTPSETRAKFARLSTLANQLSSKCVTYVGS
ncbi:hypothetical protein LY632_05005 [Erythrobacter sp. SDW2]|uniref:tetratricopeptide repeat protein n=1 Tax=Erythrobacter sp. SDW2 TaxID=2907154 RepID=UPI001F2E52C3|nr:hypothetical protein [Erythrobacter sp. SDW2]UIP07760.1 hypothetical protein LY632_05005 [Erythrobacter sp. SDW2]